MFDLVSFCFSFLWVDVCSLPLETGEVLRGTSFSIKHVEDMVCSIIAWKSEICPASYCCSCFQYIQTFLCLAPCVVFCWVFFFSFFV